MARKRVTATKAFTRLVGESQRLADAISSKIHERLEQSGDGATWEMVGEARIIRDDLANFARSLGIETGKPVALPQGRAMGDLREMAESWEMHVSYRKGGK